MDGWVISVVDKDEMMGDQCGGVCGEWMDALLIDEWMG